MIAVTARIDRDGQKADETILVPANHGETVGVVAWGLIIAGGLLLAMIGFVGLILFAA